MSNRGYPLWERWEDAIIERDYTAQGWKVVHRQLPHRSKGAITTRANGLGIRGTKKRQRRRPPPPPCFYPLPAVERIACEAMRGWGGPVNRESPLAWRVRV
jgi:hypothetical protein